MEHLSLKLVVIAVGGAIGAVLRFAASNGIHQLFGRDFPYGTLSVNVIGSFLIGILYILMAERFNVSPELRAFVLIGLLGAFTTFSTFSLETFNLIEAGELIKALTNIALSVVVCLFATWIGIMIARQI